MSNANTLMRTVQRRRSATRIAQHPDLRHCTACTDPKPATDKYFRSSPDGPDGFRTQCRACENKKRRKQNHAQ